MINFRTRQNGGGGYAVQSTDDQNRAVAQERRGVQIPRRYQASRSGEAWRESAEQFCARLGAARPETAAKENRAILQECGGVSGARGDQGCIGNAESQGSRIKSFGAVQEDICRRTPCPSPDDVDRATYDGRGL